MKCNLILLIFTTVSLSAFAGSGGDHAGNGDGISENNAWFSIYSLPQSIAYCLGASSCNLDSSDRYLLEKILAALSRELQNPKIIEFKKDSDFFLIGGFPKIARTLSHVGATIYINLDRIYWSASDGSIFPIGIEQFTSIFVHELGHHQGVDGSLEEEMALDRLGAKVGVYLHQKMIQQELSPSKSNILATLIDHHSKYGTSHLQISDGQIGIDVSHKLNELILCPNKMDRLGFSLGNLFWEFKSEQRRLHLRASGLLICSDSTTYQEIDDWGVHLQIENFVDKWGVLRFKPETSQIQVEPKTKLFLNE